MNKKGVLNIFSIALVLSVLLSSSVSHAANNKPMNNAWDSTIASQANPAASISKPLVESENSQKIILANVKGNVEVLLEGTQDWISVKSGDSFTNAKSVRTPSDGSARLIFEHAEVSLLSSAVVHIEEAAKANGHYQTLLQLDLGKMRADVQKLGGQSQFKVTTPTAVATVRGTILFLDVQKLAQGVSDYVTSLFVETGSVDFSSILDKLNSLIVDQLGQSEIDSAGNTSPVTHLSEDQKDAFVNAFDQAFRGGNPQTGVENQDGDPPQQNDQQSDGNNNDPPNNDNNLDQSLQDLRNQQDSDGGQLRNNNPFPNANANRLAIQRLRDNAVVLGLSRALGLTNQTADESTAGLLSNGPDNFGSWDYDTLNSNFDQGIVSSNRQKPLANIQSLTQSSTNELGSMGDGVNQLNLLLNTATNTDDNAGLLTQAQSVFGNVQDSSDLIETNGTSIGSELNTIQTIRDQERALLGNALNSIIQNQNDLQFQANVEKQFDAQTGKVFTDIHGNRVRVDQYIDQPSSSSVRLTSLTYRSEGPLQGISAAIFNAGFNSPITGSLRQLDWNTYLNVVTHDQLKGAIKDASEENNARYRLPYKLYHSEEFIVYESGSRPDLYLTSFSADFRNPTRDRVLFEQYYGRPTRISLGSTAEDTIWAQGLVRDRTYIEIAGDPVKVAGNNVLGDLFDYFTPPHLKDNNFSQSETVDLDNFNPFSPENNPAFFKEGLLINQGDGYEKMYLLGMFVPFDNNGNILDGSQYEGFKINGLRDLISPNRAVNGGNYNLEVIFQLGYASGGSKYSRWRRNYTPPTFNPIFTIDTIITPEIFQPYGSQDPYTTRFPDMLDRDDYYFGFPSLD